MAALPGGPAVSCHLDQARRVCKAKADRTFKDFGHFGLVRFELEGREEAQGAQMEGHNRRHAALQAKNTPSSLQLGSGIRIQRYRLPGTFYGISYLN